MISERDRQRARDYIANGLSWQEVEALIPGIDLNQIEHPNEETQEIIALGTRCSPAYLKGRLLKIADAEDTPRDLRVDILLKMLSKT